VVRDDRAVDHTAPVGSRWEFTVDGPLARSAAELIRSRFDGVSTRAGNPTVLVIDGIDQAGVRAVLTLLWDTGHEVYSMGRHPG
jgi:hypothetical protein